ncbi:MAG: hypothetical protein GKS06_10945 [Acidobacteria bacterium]|nr:hypothetical protein [Acidobacteriota bacterium]
MDTHRRQARVELGWPALVVVAGVVAFAIPISATSDGPLDALGWLVGTWQGEFLPHGPDRAAPSMTFDWGPDRAYLNMTGYQPAPDGGLVPEHETVFVWDPIDERIEFYGTYASSGSDMLETGYVEVLASGAVRLHMAVHYAAGIPMPFGAGTAGAGGHTLNFRRTLRPDDVGLVGTFVIERETGRWENPHPQLGMDEYPWSRLSGASAAMPGWARTHLEELVRDGGRWITSNAAYTGPQETDDEYGMEWTSTIGERGVRGRLFGLRDGRETSTYWEFHTFWHPQERRLRAEQFGATGAYGTGHITVDADGVTQIDQTFFAPDGSSSMVRHRSVDSDDVQDGQSFNYVDGEWQPRRSYVWHRTDRE